MRRLFIIGGLALTVPVFILVTLLMQGRGQAASGPNLAQTGEQAGQQYNNMTPIPTGNAAPDVVATVQARGLPTTRAVGGKAITPPVTEEKVRAYVGESLNSMQVIAKSARIDSIQFVTVAEMKEQLQASNRHDPFVGNYPLDQQIVYVSLSGEFQFYDMDNVEHIYPSAFRVFDAETGNELMGGSGPK